MGVRGYVFNIKGNSHVYCEKTTTAFGINFLLKSRRTITWVHVFDIKIELSRGYVTTCTVKIRHQPIRPHQAYMRLRFLDDQDYQLASQLVPPLSLFGASSVIFTRQF